MIVAFIPMLMTAAAYYYLNRADPDAGTTFSWVTRALGPWPGWVGGWAIVVADIIVMANLAEIAAIYTYDLVGNDDPSKWAVLALGCGWIALMTWICYVGIEASARTQYFLLTAEIVTLLIFAAVALWKVYTEDIPGLDRSVPELVQPVRDRRLQRARRRLHAGDLHLLGLGLDRHGQRGEQGRRPRARARPPSSRR